jgi:hypothetical protein
MQKLATKRASAQRAGCLMQGIVRASGKITFNGCRTKLCEDKKTREVGEDLVLSADRVMIPENKGTRGSYDPLVC